MHAHDETLTFQPKFDDAGLIGAVVTDAESGKPLMFAFMNEETLRLTLKTGEAHFYSRSRSEIWHKGGTSGNILKVSNVHIDCDQDVLWVTATPLGHGAACHTGRKSCFYRKVLLENGNISLQIVDDERLFDPNDVY